MAKKAKTDRDIPIIEVINLTIDIYFSEQRDDKFLIEFSRVAGPLIYNEIKGKKKFDDTTYFKIRPRINIFMEEFVKKNPGLYSSEKHDDLIIKFFKCFIAEILKFPNDIEAIIKDANSILPKISFIEGDSVVSKFAQDNLNYINSLKPEKKLGAEYIIWKKGDLNLLVEAMKIRSITNTEVKLQSFFRGQNVTFNISDDKLKHFAVLINHLSEKGYFQMNVGKFNYSFFERHIEDFPYRPKTNFMKKEVSKFMKEKSSANPVFKELNVILKESNFLTIPLAE